jgi:hypothetical protein
MKSLFPFFVAPFLFLGACSSQPVEIGYVTKENYYHRRPGKPGGHFHREKTLASFRPAGAETAAETPQQ